MRRPLGQNVCARVVLFGSAEEAWFWYVRCQVGRLDGARFGGDGFVERPCEPDDVYLAAVGLRRRRVLSGAHLAVMARFGLLGYPPDVRCREEAGPLRLWREAFDRLGTVLRAKGIVS